MKNKSENNADHSGQTINISGSIQGGNVTIGGSQIFHGNANITTNDLKQTIRGNPNISPEDKEKLAKLVTQLDKLLENVPSELKAAAQKVADRTEELVSEVNEPEIEPEAVEMKANLLKKAAENIKEAMPAVLEITTQIVMHVLRIGSIGF
ncbi:MAG TPA: hypothetical protein VHP14_02005 [Anaerolineales bacterium]|nr:hypothetical protein [Anaerolineales bacterium]